MNYSQKIFAGTLALILVAGMISPALADPIPTLFGTGLNGTGVALPLGSADPHYIVLENGNSTAFVMNPPHPSYFPNDANSQWVWQQANGQPVNVIRTFVTTFDLTGLDPSTAQLDLLVGADKANAHSEIQCILCKKKMLRAVRFIGWDIHNHLYL